MIKVQLDNLIHGYCYISHFYLEVRIPNMETLPVFKAISGLNRHPCLENLFQMNHRETERTSATIVDIIDQGENKLRNLKSKIFVFLLFVND